MSDPAAVMSAMLSDLQGLAGLAGAVPSPAAGIAAPAASSFLDTLKDAVARVESAYGDRNLICSCLPTDAYAEAVTA